jgi:tetratricopeptide (TPR) repeat protein
VFTLQRQEKPAMADFAKAVEIRPKLATLYIYRGLANAEFSTERTALSDFLKATNLDPKEPAGFREAAWIYASSSTLRVEPRANELGRTACDLTEWNDWRCLETYALAKAIEGDFPEAIRWADKAFELAPATVRPEIDRRRQLYQTQVVPTSLERL